MQLQAVFVNLGHRPPGQASPSGDAFSLLIAEDAHHVFTIGRFINQRIVRVALEDFDYRYTALFEKDKPRAKRGYTGCARAMPAHGGYHFAPNRQRKRVKLVRLGEKAACPKAHG